MTLNTLLNEIQYGKEYTNLQVVKESVEKNYDAETGIFYATGRIKDLANKIVLTESEETKIGRLVAKLSTIETKLENGKLMSEAYRKYQATAIVEDCASLFSSVEDLRKVDSEKIKNISKIVATTKYFVEENIDADAVFTESKNPLINKYVKDELSYMEQVL